MPDGLGQNIQIDHIHARAICDEIADRLRVILRQTSELPPYLSYLMSRLAEIDEQTELSHVATMVAPSIVPWQEDLIFPRDLASFQEYRPAAPELVD
jgi:hypothetical protein